MKAKKNITEILKHVYLLIITFIVLTPIYYLIVTTFKSGTEAAAKPMALPSSWDITPYIQEHLEILFLLQYVLYLAL